MDEVIVTISHCKKAVQISNDGIYGFEMKTMRNGFQWSGFPVDDELLDMIAEAIDAYKKQTGIVAMIKTWTCYTEVDVDDMLKNARPGDIIILETREASEYWFYRRLQKSQPTVSCTN